MMPLHIGSVTLYDVEELSERLHVHEVTVRKLLRTGKLPGRKLAKRWYVSEQALQEFFRQPEPAGEHEEEETAERES
jgi:excisionase family DNA binding protein